MRTLLIGLLGVGLVVGSLAACGGSGSNSTASGGSGGASSSSGNPSGSSSGGKAGTGGGNASGGESPAGSGGTNGSGGNAGTGGAAPMCPPTQPMGMGMGDACTDPGQVCKYTGEQCTCEGFGNVMDWRCTACPDNEPSGACMAGNGNFGSCTYGDDKCTCIEGMWTCGKCPNMAPTDGSTCMTVGLNCPYDNGMTDCTCYPDMGGMMGGDTWHCPMTGGNTCPMMAPASGDPCFVTLNKMCTYPNNKTCTCVQSMTPMGGRDWSCN
jgi:hypothetical protein